MRVVGAKDTLALGDCSLLVPSPLPPTAQVRGVKSRIGKRSVHLFTCKEMRRNSDSQEHLNVLAGI